MGVKFKLLVIGMASVIGAGNAAAADLVDVFEMAVSSDPALLGARAQLSSTSELRRQARANLLPQIGATTSITRGDTTFSIDGSEVSDTDVDTENINFQLRQSIYNHRNYQQLDQAKAQVLRGEAEYEDAYQTFALRVAERYFAVLTAEDALGFARAEERAVGRQLEQADQRYEVGLTAITDVHEAKARHDNARARVIVAENSLDDAREALAELTGQHVGALEPLQAELPLELPEPADVDEWVTIALSENPALIASRLGLKVAEEGIDLQRAGHFPTLDAILTYNESTDNTFTLRDDFQNVIGTTSSVAERGVIQLLVDVPIFEGGRTSSQVRQAVADYEVANQRLEENRRSVVRQTRNAYRATQASILEVEAREQALISAQSALEATEAGFEVGTRTIVDVLLSQQNLFQAERDYSQARHDYVLNVLRLKQAAGVLERQDLLAVNRLLSHTEPTP